MLPSEASPLGKMMLVVRIAIFALAALVLPCMDAAAAEVCQPLHDAKALMERPFDTLAGATLDPQARYVVSSLEVVRRPLFNTADPAEDEPLFQLANRWHADTREGVVRTILLFREGDAVAASLLAESERKLRRKSFLYDARVIANRSCDGHIDVAVVTRDVWSLSPSFGISRTGGEERLNAGLSDANLLGTGTSLEIDYFDNLDRKGVVAGFAQPNLGGSRVGLRLRVDETDDGRSARGQIRLPFHALDARRAWNLAWEESERRERRFLDGEEASAFRVERKMATASFGRSAGLRQGFATRWRFGASLEQHRFAPEDRAPAPLDRSFAFPWVSFERIEDAYVRTRNVGRVRTTEDVFLGSWITARLGYSPRGDGHVLAQAAYQDGWNGRAENDELARDTLLYGLSFAGNWNRSQGRAENTAVSAWADWRRRHSPRLALHVGVMAMRGWNLPLDRQLLLGGDTGLRGYPNRLQAGDARLRVTFEERYYSDLYLARVLRVAAAAFLDIGHAWGGEDARGRAADDILANIGVGLRFESTRTNRDIVYHIDLAHPLTDGPGVAPYQLTLTGKREL